MREKCGDPITPDRLTCPICLEEFTAEDITDHQDYVGCSKCGRWLHPDCSACRRDGLVGGISTVNTAFNVSP